MLCFKEMKENDNEPSEADNKKRKSDMDRSSKQSRLSTATTYQPGTINKGEWVTHLSLPSANRFNIFSKKNEFVSIYFVRFAKLNSKHLY